MSELNVAPGGDSAPAPVVTTPADTSPISPSQAARALAQRRVEKQKEQQAAPETPTAPEVEQQELAATPSSDPPPEAPAEATEQQPEPAQPPIEPPRSWTKEEKEEFATYPREAQEKIARREQERESALRRSQNEYAEKQKGLTAKEQAAEQAQKQYEAALPALLDTLQREMQGEFSDIKSMADVEKLAREDWPRYALWDAQQKKIAAVAQEVRSSQERAEQKRTAEWTDFASKQDAKLIELVPELSDKARATKVAESAVALLKDVGFSDQEIGQAWNTERIFRDGRMQAILYDAVRYREAKANAAKPAPKPLPPVQKPGVAAPRGAAQAQVVQTLSNKLEKTGSLKDAVALLTARRKAAN